MRRRRGEGGVRPGLIRLATVLAVLLGCDTGAPERVEAPADTTGAGTPLRFLGPNEAVLSVPVHLNGQGPFDFVLDTGATLTCVDPQIVERLDLPERMGPAARGIGIGGGESVDIVRIDSLRVGSAKAFDLAACVVDLERLSRIGAEVHGLVGLNMLKSFRVILDFPGRRLYLTAPENGTRPREG